MFNVRFALSYREHMEQFLPGIYCLGSLLARSYKTKQLGCMIS